MHKHRKTLIIGKHTDLLNNVIHLLDTKGYEAKGASTDEEAIAIFESYLPESVVIGGGIDKNSRDNFHELFPQLYPIVRIVDIQPDNLIVSLKNMFKK